MIEIYNREYYKQYDVGISNVDYEGSIYTETFLTKIADHIAGDLHPRTVLDAGCAMGYLVAALRDRGVEAYGIDISEYAISKVREDIRPYCVVGSLTEPLPAALPHHYDLVVTIEVLEHLYKEEGKKAIQNLCAITESVIFSSTPDDFVERTHFNVQQREYWACLFAAEGFFDDLNYRPTYLTPYAVCYRRGNTWLRQVEDYERTIRINEAEIKNYRTNSSLTMCRTQAFFDTGHGYREEESECRFHSYNEDFEFHIPVGAEVKSLRVDPADSYAIVSIKKCCALCDEGMYDLDYQSNGIQIGNAIMFDTTDPQILFSNFRQGSKEVKVTLSVVQITPDVIENYGRLYYAAQEAMTKADAKLHELIEEKEGAIQLRDHEIQQQAETIRQRDNEIQQQAETVRQRDNEIQQQAEAIRQREDEICQQKKILSQQESMLEKYNAELQQARSDFNTISNAFCWKITKPLRVVLDMIKYPFRKLR